MPGRLPVSRLRPYVDELEERFGKRKPGQSPAWKISAHLRQALARLLMKNHWFSKNLLIRRWFLHAQDRPLPASITIVS